MNKTISPVGAIYHGENRCTFRVWAPLKKSVELILDNNASKSLPMTRDEFGVWFVTVDDIEPEARYFFRIDGDKTLPDPASRYQPEGVRGPSAVVPTEFNWTDDDWKGIPMKDMIIYEIHVGTFSDSSDFDGIIKRLGYLKELGVNAIELMPVSQFPGARNWGYDGVYPFAVQNSYGGPEGLKRLVNEAHHHGIAVILDVVYNHQGPEGNYFGEYAPYFTEKYRTFWGSAINYDDAYCDGVRNYYWQNALMWLDEFHIDGLRMDAVHAIWDFSANHFIEELVQKVAELKSSTGREKVLIAEFDLNNPRYINPPSAGGYGMDGQWIDEFHHALHSVVTKEKDGYYEDFGDIAHLAKAMKDSYVYTGEWSVHRKKFFGRKPEKNAYSQFVVFAQNHDQVGNRMLGDRLTNHLNLEQLKLTAAAYLLSPQVPMLFMGEEYGEKKPFQYFISHTDEKLVKMVQEGRKKEFSYFKWEGEVPDPQSERTFRQCMLSWNYESDPNQKVLLNYYKHLINFRKTREAMKGDQPDYVQVYHSDTAPVITLQRSLSNDNILIVYNFDDAVVPYRLPVTTNATKIFDSASIEWRGPGEISGAEIQSESEILLQPHSTIILEF